MARIQDITPGLLQFSETTAPATPASGVVRIYAKSDGKLYCMDDAGTEYLLALIAGGTMTGALVAQTNTNYGTAQMRNVIISTSDPSGGNNGDIWIKYTP